MSEHILIGLTSILVFGVGAQWLAWRTRLPGILLLLLSGILAGPVLGLLNPDAMMGEMLAPFISISVAIILFEGGLSLRFSELKETGGVIGNLVSIGVLITWGIIGLFAHYIFGMGWEISILLGAILVVTGPTVILPLLRQVRPTGQVGSILKWEGIVIDPIGAMLAVLVYEVILASSVSEITSLMVMSIVKTILFGTLAGLAGAGFIYYLLKRHKLPDFLHNPVSLMVVVLVFTVSNLLQHESGLWAVTLMGIALANQKRARIHHIVEFKENLRVLLLSALFILLAARVELADLISNLTWEVAGFIGVLILVVRPLSVWLSTIGSSLSLREKLFLGWMAPRGVVAASISSIFAIGLMEAGGFPGAERIIPIVLIVIICTVAIYGLSASWVARKLGVAKPVPNGVMIVGAHSWALQMAKQIQEHGFKVLVADSNRLNIEEARTAGVECYHGNVLSEFALEEISLDGIGRMLSLTSNDEVNSLTALRFGEYFGRSHVYQLSPSAKSGEREKRVSEELSGRILFHESLSYEWFTTLMEQGAEFHTMSVSSGTPYEEFLEAADEQIIPLFRITGDHEIEPFTVSSPPAPAPGDEVIYLSTGLAPEGENSDADDRPPPKGQAGRSTDTDSSAGIENPSPEDNE